jgi:hypothetical protein
MLLGAASPWVLGQEPLKANGQEAAALDPEASRLTSVVETTKKSFLGDIKIVADKMKGVQDGTGSIRKMLEEFQNRKDRPSLKEQEAFVDLCRARVQDLLNISLAAADKKILGDFGKMLAAQRELVAYMQAQANEAETRAKNSPDAFDQGQYKMLAETARRLARYYESELQALEKKDPKAIVEQAATKVELLTFMQKFLAGYKELLKVSPMDQVIKDLTNFTESITEVNRFLSDYSKALMMTTITDGTPDSAQPSALPPAAKPTGK